MAVIEKNPSGVDYQLQLNRQFGAPLDSSSVQYDETTAEEYASESAIAYVGQVITVVDEAKNKVELRVIGTNGVLEHIKIDDGVLQ